VDAGTLHRGWGAALGLAYAVAWSLFADRAPSALDAGFHALASILIAYPLIGEVTARFGILPPPLAAACLLAMATLHAVVAWRRDLRPILWIATLAALGTGFALMAGRQAIEPFVAVFLLLGAAALWAARDGRWPGLRWPTALGADLGVLILVSLAAWPGGPPEAYRSLAPGRAMTFGLALPLLYLGAFARQMVQRRPAGAFEVVQSLLALGVGFGGALRVAQAGGSGTALLGGTATLAGLACAVASRPSAEEREDGRAAFAFFTTLGLGLLLVGGSLLLPRAPFTLLGGGLGFGTLALGLHRRRSLLVLQGGACLLIAALASRLASESVHAFLDPAGPLAAPALAGLFSLATLSAGLALFLLRRPGDAFTVRVRPVVLCLGAAVAAGWGSLAIRISCGLFSAGGPHAGTLAAVRTGVLSLLAIGLAWLGRQAPILGWRWLVYPLLAVTAAKFLLEDLTAGRPLTLFLAFMTFGATLILAPRLLKAGAAEAGLPRKGTP